MGLTGKTAVKQKTTAALDKRPERYKDSAKMDKVEGAGWPRLSLQPMHMTACNCLHTQAAQHAAVACGSHVSIFRILWKWRNESLDRA